MFEGFANVWTPVVPSDKLKGKPLALEVAGERLALFRDRSGGVGALLDRCPHRGAALSLGTVTADGCLACPFHGWEFQPDGACARIPLNEIAADKRSRYGATALPARDLGGLLWVFTGQDAKGEEPPVPKALVEPGWEVGFQVEEWQAHWTRAMENMLDTPHLPYVHGKSIGRDLKKKLRPDTVLKMRVEAAAQGARIYSQWDKEKEENFLDWLKPNGMQLRIMDGPDRKMYLHAYCIPIGKKRTRMLIASARTFLRLTSITWLSARFVDVLGEDREVLETSDPPEVPLPSEELSVPTDAPTLFFRKYYFRELRESHVDLVPTGRLVRKNAPAEEPSSDAIGPSLSAP